METNKNSQTETRYLNFGTETRNSNSVDLTKIFQRYVITTSKLDFFEIFGVLRPVLFASKLQIQRRKR